MTGRSGDPGAGRAEARQLQRASGVRALEERLLEALARDLERTRSDPSRLSAPLRLVVPSRSLRLHLCERIATRLGAAPGVQVQTLAALASDVGDRAGVRAIDPASQPLAVRRDARREPALARELDGFDDAWAPVAAAVDDLLDAGFEPVHASALQERIDALPIGGDAAERARALVRVASRLGDALDAERLGHRSRLFATARACIEREPACLAARAVWIYGFSDATGVQADLLEALMRGAGARVWLDEPRDPTLPGAPPLRGEFGAGLRQRLAGAARDVDSHPEAGAAGALRVVSAPDRSAEVRALALRLQQAQGAGIAPERIGVVARDLAPYRLLLRAQLRRLGVPFSGLGEPGAATAARRRLDALLALLADEGETPVDRWLDALERIRGEDGRRAPLAPTRRADLRDALHRSGRRELAAVAELLDSAPERGIALDARRGLRPPVEGGSAMAAPRRVPGGSLAALGRSAAALLDCFRTRPGRATGERQRRWLEDCVRELGWRADSPGRAELGAALRSLEPLASLELERSEFGWLLERALAGAGVCPLGGAGGGVQVLSVMEARARSFERLFVLGASRGVFPRNVREDPLLPDALRLRLREVLPDLPVKREGFDEERFLFAQLASAAPEVTFSHALRDEDGRPLPRSPLVESLLRCDPSLRCELAPAARAAEPPPAGAVESPGERALRLALHGRREDFEPALAGALEAAGASRRAGVPGEQLARARLAVLRELDGWRSDAGPYFGFVGAPALPADLRREPVFVTTFEGLARCPWQAFLEKLLRLSPRVDALAQLPSARDGRLLGQVVHACLEQIVGGEGGELADLLDAPARQPRWPEREALDELLRTSAEACLREAGIAVPGYARALASRARPLVERVRAIDWRDGPPAVLGAELSGSAEVPLDGGTRTLRFKADRVDRVGEALRFTDYKAGRPIAVQQTRARRDRALAERIAEGRLLQAVAYARAGGPGAEGRYLQLDERAPDAAVGLGLRDEVPWSELFDATAARLFRAWEVGSFIPRLRGAGSDEEPHGCQSCDVKQACLRGDSGARRRLGSFAEGAEDGAGPLAAARALFALGEGPE